MKRLKFLCTLFLVVFFFAMAQNFVSSFVDGFKIGKSLGELQVAKNVSAKTFTNLNVSSVASLPLLPAENLGDSSTVAIFPTTITCAAFVSQDQPKTTTEVWHSVIDWVLTLAILVVVVVVLVFMVKIILSFRRSEVFENRNIRRINVIGRLFITAGILGTLWNFFNLYFAQKILQLSQYSFSFSQIVEWEDILIGLVILLMNEILIVATQMKEENDLTI